MVLRSTVDKGSIKAINPPEKIAVAFSFRVTVYNGSDRQWESAGPNPIHIAYHWLDEDWSMVVFDGKRTKLPEGGIPPGDSAEVEIAILPPPNPGLHRLHLTLVEEGARWLETGGEFVSQVLEIACAPLRFSGEWSPDLRRRIEMTTSCRDCDAIPKHPDAGRVQEFQGQKIQVMHEGTRVVAGGYYGGWMQDIIENLRGHHEPQEELAFHHLLKRLPQGALMIEAGAFWAYYSNWFLGAVPDSKVICIEPDENNLRIGETNAILNSRSAEFHVGCIGARNLAEMAFHRESDHSEVRIPCFNWDGVARLANEAFVDLLHIDSQGAELLFLSLLPEEKCANALRFVVVSTHHASISGSATTHRDCLLELVRRGAVILCEHTVEESFSGDGLIVASFFLEDAAKPLPQVKRNAPEKSLFGKDPLPQPATVGPNLPLGQIPAHALRAEQPVQAKSDLGPIWVMPSDTAIGASLVATGRFEEDVIEDVTTFLSERYGFIPEQFVDVGANIGTHLLHALRSGLFKTGVAFEADPVNYDLLVRNIRLAGLEDQVRAFHFPISDRTGVVTIERAPDNLGDHRVRVAESSTSEFYQESQRETISLVSETLDNLNVEFQLGFGAGTLFWLDTQGHEGHVFGGAKSLLDRGALEYVVTEFWPYGLERAGGKENFFNFISRCSAIYYLRQPDWQNAGLLSPKDLLKKYDDLIVQGINHTDLLCVHGSVGGVRAWEGSGINS